MGQRRDCGTDRNVAGLLEFLNRNDPSGRTMALGSTHNLIEIITRIIPWGVNAVGA